MKSILILGRPNTGKSTLFNRLRGKREAITTEIAGTTRDIVEGLIAPKLILMDSMGLGSASQLPKDWSSFFQKQLFEKAAQVDLLLFLVDAHEGCVFEEIELAKQIRKLDRPTLLVVNKVDSQEKFQTLESFYTLGFGEPICISARRGYGCDRLMEAIHLHLARVDPKNEVATAPSLGNFLGTPKRINRAAVHEDPASASSRTHPRAMPTELRQLKRPKEEKSLHELSIAFVGQPNSGKSSLINYLLGEERQLVSDVPGTTLDTIKIYKDFPLGLENFIRLRLMDTAGLKAKKKLRSGLEYLSSLRANDALTEASVVIVVLEASRSFGKFEQQLMTTVLEKGRPILILVNKWDLAKEALKEKNLVANNVAQLKEKFKKIIQEKLSFLNEAPILFVSAKKGFPKIPFVKALLQLDRHTHKTLPTGPLNRCLQKLFLKNPPNKVLGKSLKIYYALQTKKHPHIIRLFCNHKHLIPQGYLRYLEKNLIAHFQLQGCSLKFDLIEKPKRAKR